MPPKEFAHQSMITLNNKGVKRMHNKLNNFYYNNFNQESRSKAMVIKVEYCDFCLKTLTMVRISMM